MESIQIYRRFVNNPNPLDAGNDYDYIVVYLTTEFPQENSDQWQDLLQDFVIFEQTLLTTIEVTSNDTSSRNIHCLLKSITFFTILFLFYLSDERKKSSLPTIPTINYTVVNRDTLTSVAARFDTTPSELTHLNRLNSSFIYPGQQLLVPDKSAKDNVSTSSTDDKAGGSSASGKSSPVDRKLSVEEQNDADGKWFFVFFHLFNIETYKYKKTNIKI